MLVLILASGGSVNSQGTLLQVTYCHQVEVLWLAIMSIARLMVVADHMAAVTRHFNLKIIL